jgi:hypothetical protein
MSASVEFLDQCRQEGLDATVATHLCDEPPVRQQRSCNPPDHRISVLHPVKSSVAEHCIEARAEVHIRGALFHDRKSELSC